MTIAELTPPVGEPLTLAEVKAHLRVDSDAEDALISALLRAAREHLERETGLALMQRDFRLYLDRWPQDRVIRIAKGPVRAIEVVTVYDETGLPQEIDTGGFVLDGAARPARLLLKAVSEPGQALNGIEIDFSAGFGETAADVPDTLKRALLLHVAMLYEVRGVVAPQDQPAGIPAGYERLIAPYRFRGL